MRFKHEPLPASAAAFAAWFLLCLINRVIRGPAVSSLNRGYLSPVGFFGASLPDIKSGSSGKISSEGIA